jgi:hypothetical protein
MSKCLNPDQKYLAEIFLDCMNEMWIHHYDQQTKEQSKE